MRKFISMMLLYATVSLGFISCSSDDDEPIVIQQEDVVGFWWVEYVSDGGKYVDISDEIAYISLYDDGLYSVNFLGNRYTGKYEISGNTVIGTTLDPITEYFQFESLKNGYAEISYRNSDGDKYKFKARKSKEE